MLCCIFLGYILIHGVCLRCSVLGYIYISTGGAASIEMFMCDTGVLLHFILDANCTKVQSESAGPCTKVGSNMLHVIDDGL
jgi:hypothetical protein